MAEDGTAEENSGDELPPPVREWLARIAADRGISEAELLSRLVPEDHTDQSVDGAEALHDRDDALAAEIDAAENRVDDLEAAIDEMGEEVADKIDDVRERIVQIKRETDTKAPADHEHPEYTDELAALQSDLDEVLGELDELGATVDALDDRVSTGFENFEQVVEYLSEATGGLEETVGRLTGGVNDLHRRVRSIETKSAERAALADLLADANRHGAGTAACETCDQTVRLGLLTAARCPNCESGFTDFEPKRGFFGSHTLETGERPALTGEVARPAGDVSDIVEADESNETSGVSPTEVTVDPDDAPDGDPPEDTDDVSGRRTGTDDPVEPPADEAEDDGQSTARDGDPETDDGTPLQSVDGVGSAFADRLRDAGVVSAEELAEADAEAIATAIDVSPVRTERWIDRASGLVDGD